MSYSNLRNFREEKLIAAWQDEKGEKARGNSENWREDKVYNCFITSNEFAEIQSDEHASGT